MGNVDAKKDMKSCVCVHVNEVRCSVCDQRDGGECVFQCERYREIGADLL